MNNLFKHEISLPPPSSFTSGEIHYSNKSKLLETLLPNEMQVPESEEAETMIVNGSFMVLSLKPGTSKDFDDCG